MAYMRTIYVEDLLKGMWGLVLNGTIHDEWRSNFICNVKGYVDHGNQLSTAQGATILKLSDNYHRALAQELRVTQPEIAASIKSPAYRKQPYQSVDVKREVRYVGGNKLAFRFKKDPIVVKDLKYLTNGNSFVDTSTTYNDEYRIWTICVDSSNLERVMSIIARHKFQADHDVMEYLTRCTNSQTVPSVFLMDDQAEYVYANVCNNPVLAFAIQFIMKGELV